MIKSLSDFSEIFFMNQAIMISKRGYLNVSPNPMVGCIIVKKGVIVGEGWHTHHGGNHAEINALISAGEKAYNSEVYVTLEPCCHFGKTSPCVYDLIKFKIKKIFISCVDPNKRVSGQGIQILKQAGIIVDVGLLSNKSKQINYRYFYFHTTKLPFVFQLLLTSAFHHLSLSSLDQVLRSKYSFVL